MRMCGVDNSNCEDNTERKYTNMFCLVYSQWKIVKNANSHFAHACPFSSLLPHETSREPHESCS
jgi:hypothetical protein